MRKNLASWALVGLVAVCGCSDDESDGTTTDSSSSSSSAGSGASGGGGAGTTGGAGSGGDTGSGGTGGGAGGSGGGTGGSAEFSIGSPAFGDGEMIPEVHECLSGGGDNVSPQLTWTPGPAGTMSYAVIMRYLDFRGGFLHWVIWDIPASALGLPQGVEGVFEPDDPAGAKQAPFNANTIGYYGPCSPQSTNTYQFTVYAIPTVTLDGLDDNSTKMEAATVIEGAAIASVAFAGES
ncbi:MAG: YbhB/YbcL family Raf kinase inhibitor-like protein [Polyangiaceae bacterium]